MTLSRTFMASATAIALGIAGAGNAQPTGGAAPARTTGRTATPARITRASIIQVMNRVANWQLAQFDPQTGLANADKSADGHPRGWVYATLYVGLVAHAQTSQRASDWKQLLDIAERDKWQLAPRPLNADDYAIGQMYLDLARHYRRPTYLKTVQTQLDAVLANPPSTSLEFVKSDRSEQLEGRSWGYVPCRDRWCWADALFMGPPVWMTLARQTGDDRYARYADKEFWATTDLLYDRDEHLFYRDSRFIKQRTDDGRKVFWGRGNGWVIAGLARTLENMPANIPHQRYQSLFRELATRLAALQTPQGYWTSSLLAPQTNEGPETSGTALIVYALAWGVNHGLLDRHRFEPVIDRGWNGLLRAVHPDGKLGWVQQVAAAPGAASYDDAQLYGVGGFLLAGAEMAKLKR